MPDWTDIKRSVNPVSRALPDGDYSRSHRRESAEGWPQMGTDRTDQDEALEVLRAVWRGQGQAAADLEAAAETGKSCKKMAEVGFDDFGGDGTDLTAAWRATLEREGKLQPASGSIRELILGSAESP